MKYHLLLVDDEVTLLKSMVRALQSDPNYHITGCATVDEALASIENGPPDLLITDLNLPGRSGIELVERLKGQAPIVVTTAYHANYDDRLDRRSDLTVLEKPVRLERLRQVIRERLEAAEPEKNDSPFSIQDYIQLAGLGRHSLLLTIHTTQGRGKLQIWEGEVWNVRYRDQVGEAALAALMTAKINGIGTKNLALRPDDRQIKRSWDGLLLSMVWKGEEESRRLDRVDALLDGGVADPPPSPPPQAPLPRRQKPRATPRESGRRGFSLMHELLFSAFEALSRQDHERAGSLLGEAQQQCGPDPRLESVWVRALINGSARPHL